MLLCSCNRKKKAFKNTFPHTLYPTKHSSVLHVIIYSSKPRQLLATEAKFLQLLKRARRDEAAGHSWNGPGTASRPACFTSGPRLGWTLRALRITARAKKPSDDRMSRPRCRALLFSTLLFLCRHCEVIKCVSPCHRDLNLLNSVYCLIQTQVCLSWRLIKGKCLYDLIYYKSVSAAVSYFSVCIFTFLFHSLYAKLFIARICCCFFGKCQILLWIQRVF